MLMRSHPEQVQLPATLESALALVHEWLVKVADARNLELDLRNITSTDASLAYEHE